MKLKITKKDDIEEWRFCRVFIPTIISARTDIRYYENRLIIVAR